MNAKKPFARDVLGIVLPLGILGLGIGTLALTILNRPVPAKQSERMIVPVVQTSAVANFTGDMTIDVDGTVVPYREVDLTAEVAGRIVKKAEQCRSGRFVRAGDSLFTIDPKDYQLEVNRTAQELRQAEVSVDETQVDIENTNQLLKLAENDVEIQNKDVQRMQKLIAERAVSETEFDRVLRGQVTARNALQILQNRQRLLLAQLDGAQAAVELAKTKLEAARLNLARTQVDAPIDGVIVEELVEEDSYVQKGTTLLRIEDTSAVEVVCNLRADQLLWLWTSDQAQTASNPAADPRTRSLADKYELPSAPADVIYSIGGRDYVWRGVLSRYDGIGLDPRTRTVPCRVLVADPTAVEVPAVPLTDQDESTASIVDPVVGGPTALVRGMFVNVRINIPIPPTALVRLPIEAVRPGDEVWVAVDGKLRVVPVRVAQVREDEVLVVASESPIRPADRVVVSPLPAAVEGMKIKELTAP